MNLFKLLGSLGNMNKLQQDMERATKEMAQREYEGRAGGEMVVVKVDGAIQVRSCHIDSRLIDDREKELIEELLVSALNQALQKAKVEGAESMKKTLGDSLDMPEIGDLIGKMIPGMSKP